MHGLALTIPILFQQLLHVSWHASILTALVLLVQRVFGSRLSPGWRHGLWLLVLARLALPFSPSTAFSIFNLSPEGWRQPSASRPDVRSAYRHDAERLTEPRPIQRTSSPAPPVLAVAPASTKDPAAAPPAASTVARPESGFAVSSLDVSARKADAERSTPAGVWLAILPFCWIAGVLFFAVRFAVQNVRFVVRLRSAPPLSSGPALEIIERCGRQMGIRRLPVVQETNAVSSPALYGFLRPRLVLPSGILTEFNSSELGCVFLHELGHLKRQDAALNAVIALFQVLHWFNPMLWLAFNRMRADRETACDALVLLRAGEGERRAYGETIIKILSSFNRPTAVPGLVGILEDKRQLRDRIRMIARFGQNESRPALAIALFLALGLSALTEAKTQPAFKSTTGGSVPPPASQVNAPAPDLTSPPITDSELLTKEGRLLIELGKLDEAEAKLQQALRREPTHKNAIYYLSLIKEARYAQESRKREIELTYPLNKVEGSPQTWVTTNQAPTSPGRLLILRRLRDTRLQEVSYDGVALSQVVRDLSERARQADRDKRGVNILINPTAPAPEGTDATSPPTTNVSLNDVPVRLHLRDVSLGETIDAIVKVAEDPIRYSIEEYGVVFSVRSAEPERLFTRTFRVDPKTFLDAVDHLLDTQGRKPVELTMFEKLRAFFAAAGVQFPGAGPMGKTVGEPAPTAWQTPKALFYNDGTGLLLARASMEELDIIEKAVQVLNVALPQLTLQARVIEINQIDPNGNPLELRAEHPAIDRASAQTPSGKQSVTTMTGILTDPQFETVRRAWEHQPGVKTLSIPRITTLSGRKARMEVPAAGFTLDLLPSVLADGFSVDLSVDFALAPSAKEANATAGTEPGRPLRVSTKVVIWDGQTMVIGPFPADAAGGSEKEESARGIARQLVLFITPTIVDPAGNRVHAETEESYLPTNKPNGRFPAP